MPQLTFEQVKALAIKHSLAPVQKYKLTQQEHEQLIQFAIAVAYHESDFKSHAKNKNSTARGLMQILINTQRDTEKRLMGIAFAPAMYKSKWKPAANAPITTEDKDLMFDPDYSMRVGIFYLAERYKKYKNWNKAVHAYNQGSFNSAAAGVKYANEVFAEMKRLGIDAKVDYAADVMPVREFSHNGVNYIYDVFI